MSVFFFFFKKWGQPHRHTGFCVAWLEHKLEFFQNTLKR